MRQQNAYSSGQRPVTALEHHCEQMTLQAASAGLTDHTGYKAAHRMFAVVAVVCLLPHKSLWPVYSCCTAEHVTEMPSAKHRMRVARTNQPRCHCPGVNAAPPRHGAATALCKCPGSATLKYLTLLSAARALNALSREPH